MSVGVRPDDPALLAPPATAGLRPGPRPTFSVVVPAWRCAGTIATAVRSALAQTEPPLEVVVCDDGSPDDVAGALAPFHDAVRLVRQPHAGGAAACNTAAVDTSGDFVVVLDADDEWDERRLARLGDLAAARPDLDLLTTDGWFVVDGRRCGRFGRAVGGFPVHEQATEILRRDFVFGHFAVRRDTWLRLGGFDPSLPCAHDWDLCVRALLGGARAGCVDEPLASYVLHGASLSATRPESLLGRVLVLDRALAGADLTPGQRVVAARTRRAELARARAAAAERALVDGDRRRRRTCIDVVRTPGVRPLARVKATAAALAPGWAGRRLRGERAARGRGRWDRTLPWPAREP